MRRTPAKPWRPSTESSTRSATRLAETSGRRPRGARPRTSVSERQPNAEGANSAGMWLELSVEVDVEAVEAVSEILGRFAPGGTSVEPAFELVEDGLGARIDPTRPSIV